MDHLYPFKKSLKQEMIFPWSPSWECVRFWGVTTTMTCTPIQHSKAGETDGEPWEGIQTSKANAQPCQGVSAGAGRESSAENVHFGELVYIINNSGITAHSQS